MSALSHMNAASAVPSHNTCTAEVSNERKYFLPSLQYHPSIIPLCFISELLLAFWLSWLLNFQSYQCQAVLYWKLISYLLIECTLQSSCSTCMVMKHKPSQTLVSFPEVLTQFLTEFGIWGHVQCTNYDSYWGCTVVRCDVV